MKRGWLGVTGRVLLAIGLTVAVTGTETAWAQEQGEGPKKDRPYYEQRGEIVWEVPTEAKVIALTFDDGPDPTNTPALLDLLKTYEAKATFFVIGERVRQYPDIVRREVADGHEIANHTYDHMYISGKSDAAIRREITDGHKAIEEITGHPPVWFRPPGGQYNEKIVNIAKSCGYRIALWSWHQDTKDWRTPGTSRIINKVIGNARGGDIVLFHDFVDGRWQTLDALRTILPELKRQGYQFVTVSELMEQYGGQKANHPEHGPEEK